MCLWRCFKCVNVMFWCASSTRDVCIFCLCVVCVWNLMIDVVCVVLWICRKMLDWFRVWRRFWRRRSRSISRRASLKFSLCCCCCDCFLFLFCFCRLLLVCSVCVFNVWFLCVIVVCVCLVLSFVRRRARLRVFLIFICVLCDDVGVFVDCVIMCLSGLRGWI